MRLGIWEGDEVVRVGDAANGAAEGHKRAVWGVQKGRRRPAGEPPLKRP
jgi:hypothetical protein